MCIFIHKCEYTTEKLVGILRIESTQVYILLKMEK